MKLGSSFVHILYFYKSTPLFFLPVQENAIFYFEGVDCPSSSARVHRRLCDITGMSQWNTQCNCSVPLASMQQEPLCGWYLFLVTLCE